MTSINIKPKSLLSEDGKKILDNFTDHVSLVKFQCSDIDGISISLIPQIQILKKKSTNTIYCFAECRAEHISAYYFFSDILKEIPAFAMPKTLSTFVLRRQKGKTLSETFEEKYPKFAGNWFSRFPSLSVVSKKL